MNPKVTFALRALAVISVIASAVIPQQISGVFPLILGLFPLLLIVIYSILALKEKGTTPAILEARSEQAYFLGYLSTLAAFGGIILQLIFAGKVPENPTGLLVMVAVALLATVAGLLAMTSLKDIAAQRRRLAGVSDTPWEDDVLSTLKKLVDLLSLSPASTGSVPGDDPEHTRLLAAASDGTTKVILNLNRELAALETSINTLSRRVDDGAAGADKYRVSVSELEQTLKEFVALVNGVFPDMRSKAERF